MNHWCVPQRDRDDGRAEKIGFDESVNFIAKLNGANAVCYPGNRATDLKADGKNVFGGGQ